MGATRPGADVVPDVFRMHAHIDALAGMQPVAGQPQLTR
jgi:hypothetical protein